MPDFRSIDVAANSDTLVLDTNVLLQWPNNYFSNTQTSSSIVGYIACHCIITLSCSSSRKVWSIGLHYQCVFYSGVIILTLQL